MLLRRHASVGCSNWTHPQGLSKCIQIHKRQLHCPGGYREPGLTWVFCCLICVHIVIFGYLIQITIPAWNTGYQTPWPLIGRLPRQLAAWHVTPIAEQPAACSSQVQLCSHSLRHWLCCCSTDAERYRDRDTGSTHRLLDNSLSRAFTCRARAGGHHSPCQSCVSWRSYGGPRLGSAQPNLALNPPPGPPSSVRSIIRV